MRKSRITAKQIVEVRRPRQLTRPGFVTLLLAAVAAGCSDSTGPDPIPAKVLGSYVLISAAGESVPYCIAPTTCLQMGSMELTEDGYTSNLVFRGHVDDWGPEFEAVPEEGGYRLRFFRSNRTFSFEASWREGVIEADTMPRVDASRWAPFRFERE